MSSFEFNKIFAAVLVAGIVAMLSGFIARQAVHPETLVKEAVAIEGAAEDGDHGGTPAADKPPEPILALLASADIEKGAKLSKACAACHSFEKGGPAKQGPSLWDVVNRDKGSAAGFEYSPTCKDMPGNWDYASLNLFLAKPKKYMPGTKMNYVGLKKVEDRAAIIAWLRTLADSPAALPTEAEIAAEQAASAPPAETATAPEATPPADGATPPETAPPAEQPAETPAENPAEKTEAAPEPVQKATAH
ncbi:MAG: c-type cytochrome [Alphaproteobacteria bacterium]|nr:c-type cytochrome [Alphaproteobacteria bacterium]MBP7758067.1 c-type cytochrome [Alphaproteobacteria bacterium]MBP7761500.1 c-type cytochrome [Alphaproteobacteria bacterium]MBP7905031.1 c-type cytochrome [Alphaproteobacteria bacterium]